MSGARPLLVAGISLASLVRGSSQSRPAIPMSQRGYVRIWRHWSSRQLGAPAYDPSRSIRPACQGKIMFEFGSGTAVLLIVIGIIVLAVKTLIIVPQGFEYTRER